MAIPRTFSNIINPGKATPAFEYIWDNSILTTGGNQILTGAFRAFTTSDISSTSVSVSGLNLSVGSVNLTGDNPVRVANTNAIAVSGVVQGGNLIPLYTTGSQIAAITGNVPVSVIGTPNVNVTNGVVPFSGAIQGGNLIPLYVTGAVISVVTGLVVSSSSSTAITGNPGVVVTGFNTGMTVNVNIVGGAASASAIALTGFNPNLPPLPVSGVFSASVTIGSVGITGTNSGSALGNLDVTRTYLPVSGINFSASVSVSAVAITGFNSGSALGFLDVTKTYLPVSGIQGVGIIGIDTGVRSISAGTLDLTHTYLPVSGAALGLVDITHTYLTVSGSAQGQLDLSHTYLPVSGIAGVGVIGIDTGNRSVSVINTAPIAISGVVLTQTTGSFTATVDNTNLILAVASGNALALAGNVIGSGISGALTTNLAGSAPVTGDIRNIPGTVLAISGFVNTIVTGSISSTISNPIGVSGVAIDRALPSIGGFATQFLPMGGRIVNPSGAGSITGYNATGDMAMFNIAPNGGLYTNQGVLDPTQDGVLAWAPSTGVGPVTAVSGLLASPYFGVTLPNNPARRGWFINNISTGVALVKMSATLPNTGTFDLILKGASALLAGDGASYSDSPAVYTGPVSITGLGGAPIVWRAWEL